MAIHYIIGIDPGPMVGVVGLWLNMRGYEGAPDIVQCSADVTPRLLEGLTHGLDPTRVVIAMERFVVGPRAGRVGTPEGGKAARYVNEFVAQWAAVRRLITYIERSAADVKPWATVARLAAAGLIEPTKGMRHARDAARHALFAAVRDCGLPDPLSKRGGTA